MIRPVMDSWPGLSDLSCGSGCVYELILDKNVEPNLNTLYSCITLPNIKKNVKKHIHVYPCLGDSRYQSLDSFLCFRSHPLAY